MRLSTEQRTEDDHLREAARAAGEKPYSSIRLCTKHEDHNEGGRFNIEIKTREQNQRKRDSMTEALDRGGAAGA